MTFISRFAAIVLALEMPVPIYWLVLHGRVNFWRRHHRAGYAAAVLVAWGIGDGLLFLFRVPLFHAAPFPAAFPAWTRFAGLALIAIDIFTLAAVESQLGGHRLVGHAELTGRGQLATRGLYTRLRHPRYFGMIAAVLGASLILSSGPLWILTALWLLLALAIIQIEERELHRRFGAAYLDYSERVPALLPFRFRSRSSRAPSAQR